MAHKCKCQIKIFKLLQENIGEHFSDLGLSRIQNAITVKKKNNKTKSKFRTFVY